MTWYLHHEIVPDRAHRVRIHRHRQLHSEGITDTRSSLRCEKANPFLMLKMMGQEDNKIDFAPSICHVKVTIRSSARIPDDLQSWRSRWSNTIDRSRDARVITWWRLLLHPSSPRLNLKMKNSFTNKYNFFINFAKNWYKTYYINV